MGKCRYDLSEDCHNKDCLDCALDNIKAEIEGYKSTIDNAISEDELKIEGMKEAYTDCLNIIDKYRGDRHET